MNDFDFTATDRFDLKTLQAEIVDNNGQFGMKLSDVNHAPTELFGQETAYMVEGDELLVGSIKYISGITPSQVFVAEGGFHFMRFGGGIGITDLRVAFRQAHSWDLRYCPVQVSYQISVGKRVLEVKFPKVNVPSDAERLNPWHDRIVNF